MRFLSHAVDDGFLRLQNLLLNMHAGDVLHIGEAVRASGLSEDTCRTALESLTHIGLMSREADDRFVRQALRSATH